MPLTSTGSFMLKEDALGYAHAHDSMALAYEKAGEVYADPATRERAADLAAKEREQAEEYRRIAAGHYNKVTA